MHLFAPRDVFVAEMTDPDWEPIMKRAGAIVTNRGGAPATPRSLRESWASPRWWVLDAPQTNSPTASR